MYVSHVDSYLPFFLFIINNKIPQLDLLVSHHKSYLYLSFSRFLINNPVSTQIQDGFELTLGCLLLFQRRPWSNLTLITPWTSLEQKSSRDHESTQHQILLPESHGQGTCTFSVVEDSNPVTHSNTFSVDHLLRCSVRSSCGRD